MAKAKTTKKSKAAPRPAKPVVSDVEVEDTEESVGPTQLDAEAQAFLARVYQLLFNIPRYLTRARRHGYTQKEHDLGWELWSTASGKNRPLDHWLAEGQKEAQTADISNERMRLLQEIDTFENMWFPRMRAMIPRIVPEASAERFTAAFFKDLSQQPLSPAVVDSVKTFLLRVEQLKDSKEPGAQTLYKTLGERGLTPEKVKDMWKLLTAAEEHRPKAAAKPRVGPKEIAQAQEAQLKALSELKRWYNDWATTFRGVFGTREQIALGLTTVKRREAPAPKGKGGGRDAKPSDTDDEEDQEADEATDDENEDEDEEGDDEE